MANFRTHITTSTVLGVGYGAAGLVYGAPLTTCLLGGGLCSVAGMLPDLDSDSSVAARETIAFTAAVAPVLMLHRFQEMGMDVEAIAVAAGWIYLFIRFVVGTIFKRYTVHRGMWHSIPAAAIVGLLAYLLCSCENEGLRLYKVGAAVLGFMSHLVLDELWSINLRGPRIRFKRSFGTAMKFWNPNSWWSNVSTYGKLFILVWIVFNEHDLMKNLRSDLHGHQHSHAESSREKSSPDWLGWLKERIQPAQEQALPAPEVYYPNEIVAPHSQPAPTPWVSYDNGQAPNRTPPPNYSQPPYSAPAPYSDPPRYYQEPAARSSSYYPPTGSPGRR